MKTFLKLLRVKQWVKNLFVFIPLIFSGNLFSLDGLVKSAEVFVWFSLISSCVYIINDLRDRDADRLHPLKRLRPIASGKISARFAIVTAIILFILSIGGAIFTFHGQLTVPAIILAYLVINLLYSFKLKNIAIVDVMIIAAGFVLRVLAGGVACGIWVSPWLVMMVFLLTLLVAFGKRRDDLIKMLSTGVTVRKSISNYNLTFIDQVLSILTGTVVVSYICYTLTPAVEERFGSPYVYLTSIFVIAAMLRYLQIVLVKEDSGKPTDIIYSDPFIQICGALWLLSFFLIIYWR